MRKRTQKLLAMFMAILMVITMAPIGEMSLKVDAASASDVTGNRNRVGTITTYTVQQVYNSDTGSYSYEVTDVVFNGDAYSVSDAFGLSVQEIETLVGETVVAHIYNGAITDVQLLSDMNSEISTEIEPLFFSYSYDKRWFARKKTTLNGCIDNNLVQSSWLEADVEEVEDYMQLMGYGDYDDVSIEFLSSDVDKLYFKDGLLKTASLTLDVSDILAVGDCIDITADMYINTDYEPEEGTETIPVKYNVYCGDKVETHGEIDVTIENTDYDPFEDFETITLDELFVLLYEKIDEYHPELPLKSKEPLISVFTAVTMNESITEMQGLYDSFSTLQVAIDVNNMVCKANVGGLVMTASDAYLEMLFASIESEAQTLAGYTGSAIESIIESKDFKDYIDWYQKKYGYYEGCYKEVEVHCPTDIYVTDEDNNEILTIINDEIMVYDDLVYAFVYEGEKIIYLPTYIDYNVEISATDDGTMDYIVSAVTPGGVERVVTYNDVAITKGTSYTSIVKSDVYQTTDTYDLVSDSGEIVEADSDTLPPVSSDVTDVVVAEDLFTNFSEEAIDAVADTMFDMKASVSLVDYKIALEDAVALFSAVSKYYPVEYSLLVNGDFSYRIVYNTINNYITEIRFDYGKTANLSDYQTRVSAVKTEIDALVKIIEDMSDFEKALYVHDYIVLNCQYDTKLLQILETEGQLSGELASERYSEYSVLVNGTGICGSYALAYRAILNAAGVDCIYLSSAEMNHAWNMVKIDGQWYHVDCCWDDPVPDSEGKARRTYFLRTDKEIMNLSHYSWTPGQYKATSEKYSNMPRNYDYIQKYDFSADCWYYLLNKTIYKTDKYGSEKTVFAENVIADSIACNNGSVYYADGLFVYEYNDTDEKWKPVYYISEYDAGNYPDEAYIVNFFIDGNNISYYKYFDEYYYNNSEDYGSVLTVKYIEDELKKDLFESITGITLNATELELTVFKNEYLNASLDTDYEVWDLQIEYRSSDDNIVSVDQYGTVTANNVGEAVITASFMEHSAVCTVKVVSSGSNEGTCGSNIKWTYDSETGTLALSGSGAMTNYSSGATPWYSFIGEVKSVEISSGITSIGNYAFSGGVGITSVDIPATVTSIGRYAFNTCTRLEEIDIPDKVTSIGDGAFRFCYSLKNVKIPNTVTSLGADAFYCCYGLESINIPTGISKIQNYTFTSCKSLKEISIGTNITYIDDYAFHDCESLTDLYIPSSVSYFTKDSFSGCISLKQVTLCEGLKDISQAAFNDCVSLESIAIPEGVTSISSSAFDGCTSLREVQLPSTLQEIDYYAFYDCQSLESVNIPAAVTSIEYNSFLSCYSLKEINVDEDNQYYSSVDGVLFNKDKTTLLQFPCDSEISSYTVPESVTAIGGYAFNYCTNLKSVTIPDNVTEIGSMIFSCCYNLEYVDLPDTLTKIGGAMFQLCERLKFITIPEGVTSIGSHAFSYCTELRSITIPDSVVTIESGAFVDCNNLTHIGYGCTESEFANISINTTGNSNLAEAPHIHYEFNPDTDIVVMEEKDPTCTQEGNTAGFCCAECQYIFSGEAISAKGHNYEVTDSFEGSCTENPYDVHTCSECKDSYTTYGDVSDGHKYVITVVEATCTQAGYTLEVCSACGESTTVGFTAPTGHKLVITKPSDYCENHGTYRYCCINKGCDYTEHITIDASELETETVIVDASCVESGTKKELCSDCGATMSTEILSPTGHVEVVDKGYDATDTQDGLTDGKHCSVCQKVLIAQEVIPSTGQDGTDPTENDSVSTDPTESDSTGDTTLPTGSTEPDSTGNTTSSTEPSEDNTTAPVPTTSSESSTTQPTTTEQVDVTVTNPDTGTDETALLGDVDLDGKITINDATTIQKYLAKLITLDDDALILADTNGDGRISISDATQIQKYLAQFIDKLG